jgi:hypothetical protein
MEHSCLAAILILFAISYCRHFEKLFIFMSPYYQNMSFFLWSILPKYVNYKPNSARDDTCSPTNTKLHSPTKNRSFSFRKLNSTFFHRFSAANYDSVLSLFPARQVAEIILNESSKRTKNALIE